MTNGYVVILPAQAARISRLTAVTGAAIGVSQHGNSLIINTGREIVRIGAGGQDLPYPPETES